MSPKLWQITRLEKNHLTAYLKLPKIEGHKILSDQHFRSYSEFKVFKR